MERELTGCAEDSQGDADVIGMVPAIADRDPLATVQALCDSPAELVLVINDQTRILRHQLPEDFATGGQPRLYLSEHAEAWTDPDHAEVERLSAWTDRAMARLRVSGNPRLVCRGPVLVQPHQMRNLTAHLGQQVGDGWSAALSDVPDVATWYSAWMQGRRFSGVVVSESVFRIISTDGEKTSAVLAGLTVADLARGYLGVVTDPVTFARMAHASPRTREAALAQGVPAPKLAKAALLRPYNRMPRVQSAVRRIASLRPGVD